MPVPLALFGALMSGIMMWLIWGNGMAVIQQYLDQKTLDKKAQQDMRRAIENRAERARAPLRAIVDPREGALALLSKLAMLRGEITMEQNVALSRFAQERFLLPGKPEHHTTLSAFAVSGVESFSAVIDELTPLFRASLTGAEKADLFAMMAEIAALHGGPTEAQQQMIERAARLWGDSLP